MPRDCQANPEERDAPEGEAESGATEMSRLFSDPAWAESSEIRRQLLPVVPVSPLSSLAKPCPGWPVNSDSRFLTDNYLVRAMPPQLSKLTERAEASFEAPLAGLRVPRGPGGVY